ncbi:putative glycoside hydrolase [Saccharopolyspora sp. WRP15-2]|uniref:Glycoside hydrolase n=1 Tax=Saccharopolyspora oryzae TaxID=2997343 RepID=A0ABT4VAM3_9PSEU|nr:putative glycoside hydrolase [Saccharopolyspora oryzae]MDA3631011.1 putative glycoside hydrolase [Saccharopolyspora oryzae]
MTDAATARARAMLAEVPRFVVVGIGAALVLLIGVLLARMMSTEDVEIGGLPEDRPVASNVVGAIQIRSGADDVRVLLDGREVPVSRAQGVYQVSGVGLADGNHELRVEVPGWIGASSTSREFTVDNTPPALQVDDSLRADEPNTPVTVAGTAQGATEVLVAGKPVVPDPQGGFSAVVDRPDREVPVVATDAAGNRTERALTVHIRHPGMRAVHLTGLAWTSDSLREPVLDLARRGQIDTVELDIKDESGEVVYDSAVPMAQQIGAVKGYYNARQVLDQLHGMGVRVVGRLVAFKDPVLGAASWNGGHPERVVQTAGGQPWSGGYGGYAFTNFADPTVVRYNIDIAAEAAGLGFDDILYDYVRRPDGHLDQMRIPGLTTTPEAAIADFLRQTQPEVRSRGALLGASVFGISVNRPTEIAQDIRQIAQHVDYISPMVYPSHWAAGEFDVPNPNGQPYDIVARSLAEFAKAVQGTDVQIIPWLQDFSLGVSYGTPEVAAQIGAARDNGMNSFLLWAPNCRYHGEALAPR